MTNVLTLSEAMTCIKFLVAQIGPQLNRETAIRHYNIALSVGACELYQDILNACIDFCKSNEDYDFDDLVSSI